MNIITEAENNKLFAPQKNFLLVIILKGCSISAGFLLTCFLEMKNVGNYQS